jgi:hypothetical protein
VKKINFFIVIVPIFSLLFACTLPSSIEIRGSPELRFTANKNFSDMFTELIENGFVNNDDSLSIISCSKTNLQTFMLHMEFFEEEFGIEYNFSSDPGINAGMNLGSIGGENVLGEIIDLIPVRPEDLIYRLDEDLELIDNENEPFKIDLEGLGDFLKGFTFDDGPDGVKAKLYVSGDQIVESLSIDFDFDNGIPFAATKITNRKSGFESWGNTYTGTEIPDGGISVPVADLLNENTFQIKYRVFMAEHTEIDMNWLVGNDVHKIKVELVIWLPLSLIADENDGADLVLPDDFMGDDQNKDLFGREKAGEEGSITDILDSINLVIQLNRNTFNGATLIVESPNVEDPDEPLKIRNELKGNDFNFLLSEEDMKKLNSSIYFPFRPKFVISFPANGKLQIPREFKATSLYFKAKFHYTVDL